ncbi:hypothetical protein L7F22_046370 [Adiantum nelumboides]|nr:hypothetical protein [Adiantum nelumboides]
MWSKRPPRCKRCRAYINPWAIFVEGGQKWVCNLCGTATEVAADYFCNLDMHGRRVDFDERLELSRGSVEFRVPKEYWAIQAKPPASVLLPVAPASTITETAKLSPNPGGEGEAFAGSTMGMTDRVVRRPKLRQRQRATRSAISAWDQVGLRFEHPGR